MKQSVFIIFVGFLLSTCSDNPTQHTSDHVSAEISDKNLEISNNSEANIYYFAIDQDFASRVDWVAVSTEQNVVRSMDMKAVPLSDVAGYNTENEIILYYWASEHPQGNEIDHILVRK